MGKKYFFSPELMLNFFQEKREKKSSYMAWTDEQPLPSSQSQWAGKDTQPLTCPSVKPNSSGLPMTCCQLSRAAGQQLILTPLKRDQITRTGRWMLVRLGEEDGGSLSVWRERDMQDLSRRKLARIRAL